MHSRVVRYALWMIPAFALALPGLGRAGEMSQYFPADGQERDRLTKWRIVWDVERQAGGAEALFIKEAYFSRGPGEPEIKVLGDSRIAELFSAYNRGARFYDLTDFRTSLVDLDHADLGPQCLTPGRIFNRSGREVETGPVAAEVHDDHLRWMDTLQKSRRGQALQLWAVLNSFNYRYVMLYVFRDDGVVEFRVGATANVLAPTVADEATHVHSGCWRINVALGDQRETVAKKVTLDTRSSKTVIEPLLGEARFKWNPEEFTSLRLESTTRTNAHVPPSPISYELVPMASGAGRYFNPGEEWTLNDFWLTADKANERRCGLLNQYENGESLEVPAVWYIASFKHAPRDEDFGINGYVPTDGVTLTTWAGFDLKPRNFFSSTPLFP